MKTFGRRVPGSFLGAVLFGFWLNTALLHVWQQFPASGSSTIYPPVAVPMSSSLVIGRVFSGGGGNSGALYTNDFTI